MYWDGRDCWKELCTGCEDMYVCQLWHWDEGNNDWDLEDCDNEYEVYEDPSTAALQDMAMIAQAFNGTTVEAQERFCGNFTCIKELGAGLGQLLGGFNETFEGFNETASYEVDAVLDNDDFAALTETAFDDMGNFADVDDDVAEAFMDIDSLGEGQDELIGAAEEFATESIPDTEELGWWGQAVDAFWSGFLGY